MEEKEDGIKNISFQVELNCRMKNFSTPKLNRN